MKTNRLYISATVLLTTKNRDLDYFLKSTFGTSKAVLDLQNI